MAELATANETQRPITELDVLWITAGLGCDGDTIAMTAATQPSIEDVVMGALPWIPKINFHNPFIAIENGDEFLKAFHLAADGKLGPFILVVEGSIPNEHNKAEGYWASWGTDIKTGQPILTCEWIDRLAPKASLSARRTRHCSTARGASRDDWCVPSKPSTGQFTSRHIPSVRVCTRSWCG